jgi:hypothetical protein
MATNNFPYDRDHRPYTESEINQRHTQVRKLLHSLTQGLLEISEEDGPLRWGARGYFRYRVGFLHRCVREFLQEECYPPFASEADEVEAYCRLETAQAKFFPPPEQYRASAIEGIDTLRDLYTDIFAWLAELSMKRQISLPVRCIEELRSVACLPRRPKVLAKKYDTRRRGFMVNSIEAVWQEVFWREMLIGRERWRQQIVHELQTISFVHWAAYWSQGAYVRHVLDQMESAARVNTEELNLLLTASISTNLDTVRLLLDREQGPRDSVAIQRLVGWERGRIDPLTERDTSTVWMVLLRDFASNVSIYRGSLTETGNFPSQSPVPELDRLERLSAILQMHLQAGADPCIAFVIELPRLERRPGSVYMTYNTGRVFIASLAQLVDTFKPSNQLALEALVDKEPPTGLPHAPLAVDSILLDCIWVVIGVICKTGSLFGEFRVMLF